MELKSEESAMDPLGPGATEGDVETRVVIPLLTRAEFLNIDSANIRSKEGISARSIGKGSKRKVGYVPDFCVYEQSFPALVIEAKSPLVDAEQAYSEACLYAAEINRSFPADINPCARVLATNGVDLFAGFWDTQPILRVSVQDLRVGSPDLDNLVDLCGGEALTRVTRPISDRIRSSNFKRPVSRGAGSVQILSRVEPNTFAADLAPILRRYFSSRDQTTDPDIYSRAYVSSNEVTSYDKILESYLKERISRAKSRVEITTSRRRAGEITRTISKFDESRPQGGDLQLVTGGVGAGKSLFARRYKEYLQPLALEDRSHWAFLNFNYAPERFENINEWVCERFVESIIEEGAPLDLRNAQDQERIFSTDLADRKSFYDRMDAASLGRGALERARDIEAWRQDPLKLTRGIARYLQGDRGDNLIVVFDNVDRRETATQLAAFQTALWFMDQTRSLVILQMRDATFETFKNEPPLDTYRTGQIFHISSPRFIDVVKKRLELSLEALESEAPEQVRYRTASGVQIVYPKKRAGEFLRGIYAELFQANTGLARILEALAGRNVRRALDMFMAILTSGHMPEEVIASVAQGTGFRSFPEYRILRTLMRQDFRFFNNESGFVANILHCEPRWGRPSNFLIPEILFYLITRRKSPGDNGQLGFFAAIRLYADLEVMGFLRADIEDACIFALSKELIEVETSSLERINERDCIKATASGWAHMRLLSSRIEYLASILPTTAVNEDLFGGSVFDLMDTENRIGRPSYLRYVELVKQLEGYLKRQHKRLMMYPGYADQKVSGAAYVLGKVQEAIQFARNEGGRGSAQTDQLDA